jgi:hypothetical protein
MTEMQRRGHGPPVIMTVTTPACALALNERFAVAAGQLG